MSPDHILRLRFRDWLIEHALEPEIADAILETMPPFEWSDIARRHEMSDGFSSVEEQFKAVDARFEQVDARFEQVEARLGRVETRLDSVDHRLDQLASAMTAGFTAVNARIDELGSSLQAMSRAISIGAVSLGLSVFLAIATTLVVALADSGA
jgi:septal ring factor EnvC (AmiA/AmiB activator)